MVSALTSDGTGDLRWRSLWRRTDFIGFPVDDYVDSSIDRLAQEEDTTTYLFSVATHGDYPRAPQYRGKLDDLIVMLARASERATAVPG